MAIDKQNILFLLGMLSLWDIGLELEWPSVRWPENKTNLRERQRESHLSY